MMTPVVSVKLPKVVKRSGQIEAFNRTKIENGIRKSASDVNKDINGKFDSLIQSILDECTNSKDNNNKVGASDIQAIVKRKLMDFQYHEIAEAYIIFSDRQAKGRLKPDPTLLSDYIVLSKYSRYNEELKRREVYSEIVDRVEGMHLKRYPQITDEIKWAFNFVRDKKVLPSMRTMQFGGKAMELNHAKGFNCSFSICNRPKFFSEALWLLLSGTGVGFSVQFQHIDKLPELKFVDKMNVRHFIVPDTIEGWADATNELINAYMVTGEYIEFAYNNIRQQGEPLKTSGGRAPGHLPLKIALENVRKVLDNAQGRQLASIECYDIMCMLADAVYSGGIREAAMICLFSIDDGSMMNAKTGNWYNTHPWRARSNNSVVLHRSQVIKRQYDRIFRATKQWGEPGFFFTDDEDSGINPCAEVSLNPKLEITPEHKIWLESWAVKTNRKLPKLKVGSAYWGWQVCNLSEVNCATLIDEDDFYDRVRAAAIIGTCQAGYTDFHYLGWVSEAVCNREALLGVSLTGMMDNPSISLDAEIQRNAAQVAVETNIKIASKIGINSAARVNCIKPSGTASLVLGSIGSGIHTHHAKKYFRRVRATPTCPIYKEFKKYNQHMCTAVDTHKELITFPIKAPEDAITRHDLNAIQFLEHVLSTMKNWVVPGNAKPHSSNGINHNVSNTISVKPDEWDAVREFIWQNKKYFGGVSLLADEGDKIYSNAPREEVVSEADEAKWQGLITNYKPIDWTTLHEDDDNTNLVSEKACSGGACTVSYG